MRVPSFIPSDYSVLYVPPVTPDDIRGRLQAAFPDAIVRVADTTGTGDHFSVTVVSSAFAGKGPVDRHRAVYAALGEAITGPAAPIHALALVTHTPDENQA
jgi:stress-induced morphogen